MLYFKTILQKIGKLHVFSRPLFICTWYLADHFQECFQCTTWFHSVDVHLEFVGSAVTADDQQMIDVLQTRVNFVELKSQTPFKYCIWVNLLFGLFEATPNFRSIQGQESVPKRATKFSIIARILRPGGTFEHFRFHPFTK